MPQVPARMRRLLKHSLPESFFATDYDGLRLVLLTQRLAAKCAIINKHTTVQFRLHEGAGDNGGGEAWVVDGRRAQTFP